tara:strand:+ start:1537 stop:2037 length:501 start_codon:yes stop_codon:yes gene_type:complete
MGAFLAGLFKTIGGLKGVATAASLASTGISLIAQRKQQQQQQEIMRRDAALDRLEANRTERAGREEQRRARVRGRSLIASQRTGFAAAGVRREGSPLEIELETLENLELENLELGFNTQTAAAQLRDRARFTDLQAKSLKRAGRTSRAATLIRGASNLASTRLAFS